MQNAKRVTRKTISKACDACRRRKIKCNGSQPCPGCLSAKLACTFDLPRGQGGNRGPRATVLNAIRADHPQGDAAVYTQTASRTSPDEGAFTNTTTAELSRSQIDACIDAYLDHIYPAVPLLDAAVLRAEAMQVATSPISHQLIHAFCAYVANFGKITDEPGSLVPRSFDDNSGIRFLHAAVSAQDLGRVMQPSPRSVYISFFLYGAHAGQGDYRQAWFYLREATTLFMMLKDERQGWYDEKAQRRLFWILVISERAHAVRRNRPITLQVTLTSPCLQSTTEERGLSFLASIFRPLDEVFFAVWNGSTQECSKDWLLRLEHDVRSALPLHLDVSDEEIANIKVSQFWLQIKLWELFPRFGFLSTESVYECLTFRYPLSIAKNLTALAVKLPIGSLQIHGVGMTEKIFDIACALADVLPFIAFPTSQVELNPADYLTQITTLIAELPGGSPKFVPLLLAKVNELLPELVVAMCEAVQMPSMMLNDPMSPDTRFVYEEEVGRGLYMNLRRGR
ncbi:Nn.00g090490.m01.CDS01 [Neocucurbitaria sp. VM-36]